MEKKNKTYGLILSAKKAGESSKPSAATTSVPVVRKPSVFNDDSSDEDDGMDWRKRSLAQTGPARLKKQTKLEMSRALEQDPTVYQYDEVYDAIEADKAEKVATAAEKKKEQDRKPRYIENLLKHAEIRNREKERRLERQVQKEREAEGDEFADKESFVTSAYRKKMEEMQKLEEEERKQDMMEDMLTVTKQKDMSGFYRHLYRQTMGEEKGQKEVKAEPVVEVKQEPDVDIKEEIAKPELSEKEQTEKKLEKVKARSYRKTVQDEGNASEGDSDSNLESDDDSSSSSDEDNEIEKQKKEEDAKKAEAEEKRRKELREQKEKREKRKRKIEEGETSSEDEDEGKVEAEKSKETELKDKPKREKKIKADVWTKVTIGEIFEAALQRYFARKAERTRFP